MIFDPDGDPRIWEHRVQAHSTAGAPTAEHEGEIKSVAQPAVVEITRAQQAVVAVVALVGDARAADFRPRIPADTITSAAGGPIAVPA